MLKPTPEISYDESIMEYHGCHCCKHFLRGKTLRFGYKVWALNSTVGYLIDFEIYQRRSIARENSLETEVCVSATSWYGVSVSIRLDGYMHHVQVTSRVQRRQFAGVGCTPRVRTEFKKYNLGLCIACFASFHERWNSHLFSKTTRISIWRNIAFDIQEKEFITILFLSLFVI